MVDRLSPTAPAPGDPPGFTSFTLPRTSDHPRSGRFLGEVRMLHDETGAPVVRATCYVCRELVPTIRCHYRARTYRRYDEHNGPDEKPCSASLSDVRRLRAREEPGPL